MDLFKDLKMCFEEIEDPRVKNRSVHKLIDIIVISVLGTISGANSFYELVDFAESKINFLKKYLELPGGIPSHDTFLRILSLVKPEELEKAFFNWVEMVRQEVKDDVLCVDGKVSRGTIKTKNGSWKSKLTTVSVYSTESHLVLGQVKSSGPGNCETTAAKKLIELLNIKEQIIVSDAGVGAPDFAVKIINKGGDYLFPIKKNRKHLYNSLKNLFLSLEKDKELKKHLISTTIREKGHGREEERTLQALKIENCPDGMNKRETGDEIYKNGLIVGEIVYRSVEKETRPFIKKITGEIGDKKISYERRDNKSKEQLKRVKEESRFFITSLDRGATDLAMIIRKQWAIESQLHWILDVSFEEDNNRTRNLTVANNLSTIRKIAFNFIKSRPSKKSVKVRMKRAGWDDQYLEQLITQK